MTGARSSRARRHASPAPAPVGWYIDSLDALGGIAFASMRTPWDGPLGRVDDVTAVRIAAPYFEPERMASAATGLAASRSGFQLGLYLDEDTEVGFPTLDALVEFVRRLYLRGGGRDEPPGGVGPWPPGPGDDDDGVGHDEPPVARTTAGELDGVDVLCRSNDRFGAAIAAAADRPQPFSGWTSESPRFDARFAGQRLARAGLVLLRHVLRYRPREDHKADRADWLTASVPLARCFDALEIWLLLAEHAGPQMVALYARQIGYGGQPGVDPVGLGVSMLRHLMKTGWVSRRQMPAGANAGQGRQVTEAAGPLPLDILSLIRMPPGLAGGLCLIGREETATLEHLVSAMLGSPRDAVPGDAGRTEARFELLLFAATVLFNGSVESRHADLPLELWQRHFLKTAEFANLRAARLAERAYPWVAANLPRWAFGEPLERMIDSFATGDNAHPDDEGAD